MRVLSQYRVGRIALGALAGIALATAVSIVALWPAGDERESESSGLAGENATVTSISETACPGDPGSECVEVSARLESGPDEGDVLPVQVSASSQTPLIEVGDDLRVADSAQPGMAPAYSIFDFQRGTPMIWLAIAFILLVVLFGRLRGALSLVGLLGSLVVVLAFIVPAILEGGPALAIALSGSLAVMLVTIALSHGFGVKSLAAMLGTAASLVLVVVLASAFTHWAHLSGFSEETAFLGGMGSGISLQGLLVAGMVIGALGVLDDVTISQSSTVMALRAANPDLTVGELYKRAIDVGRDHISATVNTLVLAYVGASLPVLLIFSSGGSGFVDAINRELVAKEIVATLVGSIGLIAAVPLTTILAAILAIGLPGDAVAEDGVSTHTH